VREASERHESRVALMLTAAQLDAATVLTGTANCTAGFAAASATKSWL